MDVTWAGLPLGGAMLLPDVNAAAEWRRINLNWTMKSQGDHQQEASSRLSGGAQILSNALGF